MIIYFADDNGHAVPVDFVKVPSKDEGFAAFITAFGSEWGTSKCAQSAQTSLRTTVNSWLKSGYTLEQCQRAAVDHTLGRGGPRKSNVEKELTRVEKMSVEDEEALRQKLNERAATAQEAAD